MNTEQVPAFIRAVTKMREWQKTYFRTRHPGAMQEAKKWEKEVDRFIDDETQPKMF